jgi:lambda family phage portal protein
MPAILDEFGKPYARTAGRRSVRAKYDAAQTGDHNSRHWANADLLDPNAANSSAVRQTLRSRARYEAQQNNSYAKGIALTLANDCIGTGPRLQMLTPDPGANRHIEREFNGWARSIRLAEKLRTMRLAKVVDGEAFALQITNPRPGSLVALDLQLVEADQITTPTLVSWDNAVDGIEFDEAGNPARYHLLTDHPGADYAVALDKKDIPARAVIHLFRADRPGQRRGVPEITPALPLFAQLRRYTLAVISAAETAADFAGVLHTDAPADDPDEIQTLDAFELEPRALLTLPSGWDMRQVQAQQPTTTYAEFKSEILNEIARCLNMPYNVAAGNSRQYNYASGRLDRQTYANAIHVEQHYFATACLDRLFSWWFDEAALIPGLIPAGLGPLTAWDHTWLWESTGHVDPLKEAAAQAARLANHTTTLAREYAREGLDWEPELRQRAKEAALMRELGMVPAESPANAE